MKMTTKTKGEAIFEEFCNLNDIRYEKIPEGKRPTPDYRIFVLNHEPIVVEVKQIDGDDDFTIESGSSIPGDHVRARIDDAREQAKAASNQGAPVILLIYNNLDPMQTFGTMPHDFIAAMYGERTAAFNRDNQTKGFYHGRNQSLRIDKNNSFSAVGGIYYRTKKGPTVSIYENVYAWHKLNFSLLPECIEATRIELDMMGCAE